MGMLDNANGTIASQQATVESELQQYKAKMEQDMATKFAEREQAMAAKLAMQKQQLVAALDSRLTDTIGAFLAETLGNEVDLGAQAPYLVAMLEEHKNELLQGIQNDA
jgi:hypothetical protein